MMTYYIRAEMKIHFWYLCIGFFDLFLFYCHQTFKMINTELRYIKRKKQLLFLSQNCFVHPSSAPPHQFCGTAQLLCVVPQSLAEPTLIYSITKTKVFIYCYMKLHTLFLVQRSQRPWNTDYLFLMIFGRNGLPQLACSVFCTLKHSLPVLGTQWSSQKLHLIFKAVYDNVALYLKPPFHLIVAHSPHGTQGRAGLFLHTNNRPKSHGSKVGGSVRKLLLPETPLPRAPVPCCQGPQGCPGCPGKDAPGPSPAATAGLGVPRAPTESGAKVGSVTGDAWRLPGLLGPGSRWPARPQAAAPGPPGAPGPAGPRPLTQAPAASCEGGAGTHVYTHAYIHIYACTCSLYTQVYRARTHIPFYICTQMHTPTTYKYTYMCTYSTCNPPEHVPTPTQTGRHKHPLTRRGAHPPSRCAPASPPDAGAGVPPALGHAHQRRPCAPLTWPGQRRAGGRRPATSRAGGGAAPPSCAAAGQDGSSSVRGGTAVKTRGGRRRCGHRPVTAPRCKGCGLVTLPLLCYYRFLSGSFGGHLPGSLGAAPLLTRCGEWRGFCCPKPSLAARTPVATSYGYKSLLVQRGLRQDYDETSVLLLFF